MSYLLIAATINEIKPFLASYRVQQKKLPLVDVLITGPGLMATTYSLTRQLLIKPPSLVIQAGIAGSFSEQLPPGATVVVKQDRVADQGAIENGRMHSLFDLGLLEKNKKPYSNGWLKNNSAILNKPGLEKVTAVSVNEISTDPGKINLYRKQFKPLIETMEGAALHYVCLNEKIPFLQLRSVSNFVGERNKSNWKLKESIHNLNRELFRLLKTI
ncbi:MAG TPA: futalosine hydrolase [Chitinophagaceae bacterium]|nr:futalosine hydrolase [Chitinophagaceae bacterium]